MIATKTITTTFSVPDSMADVALADAKTCAAVGAMSISWWHAEVAAGRAPAPVIRKPRCTRWQISAVRDFYSRFAAEPQDKGAAVLAQACKASRAAQAKRKMQNAAATGA